MNKYDELISSLSLIAKTKTKNITELAKNKTTLEEDITKKQIELEKQYKQKQKLNKIFNVLKMYSFKVPKQQILSRIAILIASLFVTESAGLMLCLIFSLIFHKFLWLILTIGPLAILFNRIIGTIKNSKILKNYHYNDVEKELTELENNIINITKSLEKENEDIKNITNEIKEETNKKEDISHKINLVYQKKYQAVMSLIKNNLDEELSQIYDQDEVIKRILIKDGHNE